jgi:multidrug efflux pump subunit AcrA (membrane-fusion protein)
MAAIATFALKAGLWFRRGLSSWSLLVSQQSSRRSRAASPLSAPVQISPTTYEQRRVATGEQIGQRTVIKDGLQVGEKVLIREGALLQ